MPIFTFFPSERCGSWQFRWLNTDSLLCFSQTSKQSIGVGASSCASDLCIWPGLVHHAINKRLCTSSPAAPNSLHEALPSVMAHHLQSKSSSILKGTGGLFVVLIGTGGLFIVLMGTGGLFVVLIGTGGLLVVPIVTFTS